MGTATISFLSAIFLGTATRNIASEMTSRELAVVLEKLAKIEQKQDEYQSNFLYSSGVNENADVPPLFQVPLVAKDKKNCRNQ